MTGRPVLRFTLWTGGLIGAIAALHRLGTGDLGGPPVGAGATALARWATSRDPASVFMVVVRDLALAIAIYLLAATVLALAAYVSRAASLMSLSDRITVPLVRRLVGSVLGVAVAAGPFAGGPSAWATRLPPPPAVTLPAGGSPGPAVTAVEGLPPSPAPDPPTLRRLPDIDPTAAVAPPAPAPPAATTDSPPTTEAPATAGSPGAQAPAPAPTGAPLATTVPPTVADAASPPTDSPGATVQTPPAAWTVRPGDHLWGISSRALQAARRRPVSDAEVAPYWLSVVERNRASLPDPANADLLYVGMTVVLPPIP